MSKRKRTPRPEPAPARLEAKYRVRYFRLGSTVLTESRYGVREEVEKWARYIVDNADQLPAGHACRGVDGYSCEPQKEGR